MIKQLRIIRGLQFGYYATTALLLPYLPLYFQSKGFSGAEIGFLMMIGPFAAMFAQPVWGYAADRFGNLKGIIGLLWALTIASSIGLFMLDGFFWATVFALGIYFFMMPSVPLLDSLTLQAAKQAGTNYGSIRLWGSLGFSLTAVVSALLLDAVGGVQRIYWLYWGIWLLPLALLPALRNLPASTARVTLAGLRRIALQKEFLWFMLLFFMLAVPHRMNDTLFGLHLKDLGASDQIVSYAWALAAVSETVTFALLYRVLHKYHELALMGAAGILYAIRWTLYMWIGDPWILMWMQLSHSVTFAVLWIVGVQYAARIVPDEYRSTSQSILSAVMLGLAGLSGGYLGGWIKDTWGGEVMYGCGAAMAAAAAFLLIATRWREQRRNV